MEKRTRKIIAREIVILFSIIAIVGVSYGFLIAFDRYKANKVLSHSKAIENLIAERDSLRFLSKNQSEVIVEDSVKWIPPDDAVLVRDDVSTSDSERAIEISGDKQKVKNEDLTIRQMQQLVRAYKPLEIHKMLIIVTAVLFGVAYVIRPLSLLLVWAIRTLKE